MSRQIVVMVMVAWVAVTGCRPQAGFESAATELLVAALPEVQVLAQAAKRETAQGGEGVVGSLGAVAEEMANAVSRARMELSDRSEGWQVRVVFVLREALVLYERMRAAGVPLPAPPTLVRELLTPCPSRQ